MAKMVTRSQALLLLCTMRSALPLAPKKLPMPLWRVAPAVSDAADGKASTCAFGPVAVATDPRRFLEAQLGLGLSVAQLNVTASEVRCVARFEGDGLDAVEVAVSDSGGGAAAMLSVTVEGCGGRPVSRAGLDDKGSRPPLRAFGGEDDVAESKSGGDTAEVMTFK